MSRRRPKKSVRQIQMRYRPELFPLENRVAPSASPAGLGPVLQPPVPAASLPAATAVVTPAESGDQNIGSQVSAQAQELQDGRTSDGPQGIGADLSDFVHTLVPPSSDQGDSGDDGSGQGDSGDSGDQGIGSQVSAK